MEKKLPLKSYIFAGLSERIQRERGEMHMW